MKIRTDLLGKKCCCNRTFEVEGIGKVTFPPGVNELTVHKEIEYDLFDSEPSADEILSITTAIAAALDAVNEVFDKDTASRIKTAFAPTFSYKGAKKMRFKFPFKIILSEDFWGIKISVFIDLSKFKFSYDIEKFLKDKLSALEFLALDKLLNPPRFPRTKLVKGSKTNLTKDDLLKKLNEQISPDEQKNYESLSSVQEIIAQSRKAGIILEEEIDMMADLLEAVNEDFSSAPKLEVQPLDIPASADSITDKETGCANPDREVSYTAYSKDEVDLVSTQCCEPVEPPSSIPYDEIPDFKMLMPEQLLPNIPQTSNEIMNMVETIKGIAAQLQKCSEEKAFADMYREKLYRLREDMYPLYYYMLKRNEYFENYTRVIDYQILISKQYEEITKSMGNVIAIGTAMFKDYVTVVGVSSVSITTANIEPSISKINSIIGKITSDTLKTKWGSAYDTYRTSITKDIENVNKSIDMISQYLKIVDDLEKQNAYKPSLAGDVLTLLKTSLNVDLVNLSTIFAPSESKTFSHYTNQSGIDTKNKGAFYLMIDTEKEVFDEIVTMYKMIDDTNVFNLYYRKDEALDKTKVLAGVVYREVWDKFNSTGRVDFLFTAKEQGYLTRKPSNDDVASKNIEDVEIDDDIASKFLSTYDSEQEVRLLQKILLARKKSVLYFGQLDTFAKDEASKSYQAETLALSIGFSALADKMKKQREEFARQFSIIESFNDSIGEKIDSLIAFSNEKKLCFDNQEKKLKELYPDEEKEETVEAPCTDPLGVAPAKGTNPGPIKNCYWRQYTKHLQSVSFMPIPDLMQLNKRLFRYYPVGLQIPVPAPPGVLPTLASGIPDANISIPMPILWKHIFTLTTPAGQFVLWLTYCPPFTLFPYLMYLDEVQSAAFVLTPHGQANIPSSSLGWQSFLDKSMIERIPGLKIPMSALPPVDSKVDNNKPDSVKAWLEDMKKQVKTSIDKLSAPKDSLTKEELNYQIEFNKKKKKVDEVIKKIEKGRKDADQFMTDLQNAPAVLIDFIKTVEKEVSDNAVKMIDFEPFKVPKTTKKRIEPDVLVETESVQDKVRKLMTAGSKINVEYVDVAEIIQRKTLTFLETGPGKKLINDFDKKIRDLESKYNDKAKNANAKLNESIDNKKKKIEERLKIIQEFFAKIIKEIVSKINPADLGFVETALSLIPAFLPFPCKTNLEIPPMPAWMGIILGALASIPQLILEDSWAKKFEAAISVNIDLSLRLPSAKDLIIESAMSGINVVLGMLKLPIPGWPNNILYISNPSVIKEVIKDSINAIFKVKLRMPPLPPGMPPYTVTPELIRELAKPIIETAVTAVFSIIIEQINELIKKALEQIDQQTINNIMAIFALVKAILGTSLEDITLPDVREMATNFVKNALEEVLRGIETALSAYEMMSKEFISFMSMFSVIKAAISYVKLNQFQGPYVEVGTDIIRAIVMYAIVMVSEQKRPMPLPWIVNLLLCSTGVPGWIISSLINPIASVEKTPPWERLCLKNAPYVVFLDHIAATAQRYGGIGNSYVLPYFTPET